MNDKEMKTRALATSLRILALLTLIALACPMLGIALLELAK